MIASPAQLDLDAALKLLSDPLRLRILALLGAERELTVADLVQALDLPQARVSQQLATLRLHGLIELRKADGFHHYRIAAPRLGEFLACMTPPSRNR